MPRTNAELYEEAERQAIGEAIAETEQEIADGAFGDDPDENTGDNSLEQIDGDDVLDEDDFGEETEESDEEAEDEQGTDDEDRAEPDDRQPDRREDPGRVPSSVVREANEARRAAEAERDAERARVRELDARLRLIEQGRKPEQRQEQQEPDIFADPEAWKGKVRADIRQDMLQTGIEMAAEEHGEAFNTAYQGLIQGCQSGDPVALATAQRIARAPQLVGKIAIGYHRQQEMLRDIGSDPEAFIERKVAERLNDPQFRRQAINGLREDAMRGDGNGPRTRTRLPPSLNSASGGTSHRGRDTARTSRSTEQDIFDSAFDD